MAIEFVVEDGTGMSTATAYLAVADYRQFWENRGKDYSVAAGYTDVTIQAAINNASAWLDYSFRFKGEILEETQALQFPRKPLWDKNDRDVSSMVPPDIASAIAYLAQYEVAGAGRKTLHEVQVMGINSKTMGPVTVSFASSVAAGSIQIKAACALIYDYIRGSQVKRGL